MKKTFIPKLVVLSDEEIAKIRKKFTFLNDTNIEELKYWNSLGSPYSGVIIDEEGQYKCFPYPGKAEGIRNDYPDIDIWED